jgi:RND family efflux transporter MFP subunit
MRQNPASRLHGCCSRSSSIVAIFLLAFVINGCNSSGKATADEGVDAPRVAVVKVARRNLTNTLQIAAEFQPFQEINVYAKVSGYIQKLYIDWGKHVSQGELLAVLEVPELQQQLELDQASVHRSEQDLMRSTEELSRAQSTYNVAHLTFTRLADVQKTRSELVAQQEIDIAKGKDLEASSGVSAAKASVAASEQALLASKASLEKDRAMYGYARISAPFNGVITEMDAYTGALLPAGTSSNKGDQALCRLSQNDLLRLVIPLPERAVSDIRLGETVAVKVSTNNRSFDGKIVRFSDQIDTATRTMHTEIDVPNPKYELVPGMYATATIPLHTAHDVVTAPLQAIQPSGEDRGAVLVVGPNNKIERRDVQLGLQNATFAEITSGLKEGDLVVFGEQSQYKTGQRVVPQVVMPAEME